MKGTALFLLTLEEAERPADLQLGYSAVQAMADARMRLATGAIEVEKGFGWGYPFPWQSRSFYVPKNKPNAVCTVFAARAMLAAHRRLGDEGAIRYAVGAVALLRSQYLDRRRWQVEYVAETGVSAINVWGLTAALLYEVEPFLDSDLAAEVRDEGRRLVESVMRHRRSDDLWPYGLAGNQGFVDGYHTGFILESLKTCLDADPWLESRFSNELTKCYEAYWDHLVDADGAPRAALTKRWPVDVHAVAQTILTACSFSTLDDTADDRARRSLDWWLRKGMRSGLPVYQVGRLTVNKTVHIRWGVAWLALALARARNVFGWT